MEATENTEVVENGGAEALEAPADRVEKLNGQLETMLDLTIRLADLTEAENLALAERRTRDVEEMLEDKATLSRLYENSMKALHDADFDWNEADQTIREKLEPAAARLTKAISENTMRLEVGMRVNQHVIDQIAEAVKDAVPHSGTYSRAGTKGSEGAKASINSVSVALDETL